MAFREWAVYAVLAVVFAGPNSCASKPPPPPPQPGTAVPVNPVPLMPNPAPTAVIHLETASYYAHKFDGRKTTSGERYRPNKLTAASKTLPLGTVVKVENPKNGKAVKVKINDRGPFVKGRALDLSRRAAEKIGIIHKGVAKVKVTIPPREPASTAREPDSTIGAAPKDSTRAPALEEASAEQAPASP